MKFITSSSFWLSWPLTSVKKAMSGFLERIQLIFSLATSVLVLLRFRDLRFYVRNVSGMGLRLSMSSVFAMLLVAISPIKFIWDAFVEVLMKDDGRE